MKHSRARARLGSYLEGDLGDRPRQKVAAHVAGCEVCRRELDELASTVALLRQLPSEEPPSYLVTRVMARVRAGEAEPAHPLAALTRWLEPRVALALAAGVTALALVVGSPGLFSQAPLETAQAVAPAASPAATTVAAARTGPSQDVLGELARELRLRRLAKRHEVMSQLRGAGHPHSAWMASHLDSREEPTPALALVSLSGPIGRR